MRYILYILLSFCWVPVLAQSDSIKTSRQRALPVVTITTSKNSSVSQPFIEDVHLDESVQRGIPFISNILSSQSDAYIKLNSGAALATASLRGSSAEQTPVLWCGINLQSPANGNIDLSLLPGFLFSSAQVIYGGTATLNGSGHVGGAISLNNNALFADTTLIMLLAGYGSFKNLQSGLKWLTATKNIFSRTTVYYTSGLNNFPFYNRAEFNSPLQHMSNAAFNEFHFMQENSFRINKKQIIDIKYWYANSQREIPPTMLTRNDSSFQNDASHRIMMAWQYCGAKTVWYIRQHILYETLNYYDGLAKTSYPSKSLESSSEIENHFYPSTHWHITSGIQYISAHAITDGYNQWHYRNALALYASFRNQITKTLTVSVSARDELVSQKLIPPVFSADATYNIFKNYSVSLQWSKHFRLPTLNELYWQPGGNLNVLPESGNLFEFTNHYSTHFKNGKLTLAFAAYTNSLANQIVWIPVNTAIWTPVNYAHIWARGANLTLIIDYMFRDFVVQLSSNNSYTRASQLDNASTYPFGDNQLIYTPRYKTSNSIKVIHKLAGVFISGSYTSQVFTDENRASYLAGYVVIDVGADYTFKASKAFDICLAATVHNITGTQYEILLYRPQPLRIYSLTLLLKFKK